MNTTPGACTIKHFGFLIYRKCVDFVICIALLVQKHIRFRQTNAVAYHEVRTLQICAVVIVHAQDLLYHITRGMYYKTFYSGNLRIFRTSWSVCLWQAFPP